MAKQLVVWCFFGPPKIGNYINTEHETNIITLIKLNLEVCRILIGKLG